MAFKRTEIKNAGIQRKLTNCGGSWPIPRLCRLWKPRLIGTVLLAAAAAGLSGCNSMTNPIDYLNLRNSFLDPSQVGRFDMANPGGRVQPVTWPILDSLAVNDPPARPWKGSVAPTVADLSVSHKPYKLGPGDVVTVSVFELVVPGQESVQTRQVNTQGEINLDFVGSLKVKGLTVRQVQNRIVQKLIESGQMSAPGPHQPGPQVNVDLTEARGRVFSILGGTGHPGTYNIMSPDFHLLDALALAGDISDQPGIRWLYVIRPVSRQTEQKSVGITSHTGHPASQSSAGMLQSIANQVSGATSITPSAQAKINQDQGELNNAMNSSDQSAAPHYVYLNGRWVELAAKSHSPSQVQSKMPREFNFATAVAGMKRNAPAMPTHSLIIRIPIRQLREGNPRDNIIIHAGDVIMVPQLDPQYYYMMGTVNRPGVYTLTGQKITIKQAVAAAGNLSSLAIPRRCELIRRIGHSQEMIIQVNLQKIFDGTEPDIFLKSNDVVNCGSDMFAYPLAVVRSGFSSSYGFGFTYDRNYYIQPTIIR